MHITVHTSTVRVHVDILINIERTQVATGHQIKSIKLATEPAGVRG